MKNLIRGAFGTCVLALFLSGCGGGNAEDSASTDNPAAPQQSVNRILAVTPSRGATNFSTSGTIQLSANVALDAGSVNTQTVKLTRVAGASVPVTVDYDSGANLIEVAPVAPLSPSTTYTVTLLGGASGVKTRNDGFFTSDFTLTFTTAAAQGTGDAGPPSITKVTPAHNATNVSSGAAITLMVNEPLTAGSVTTSTVTLSTNGTAVPGSVHYDSASGSIVFTPSAALAANTSYTVRAKGGSTGIKDLAGNAMAQDFTSAFATAQATTTTRTSLKVDFQAQSSTAATGYVGDHGEPFDVNRGYGWLDANGNPVSLVGNGRERDVSADQRLDTFMYMKMPTGHTGVVGVDGRWKVLLTNGTYRVTAGVGDPSAYDGRHVLRANGVVFLDFTPTSSQRHATASTTVNVTNGVLVIDQIGGNNTKIAYIEIGPNTGATTPTSPDNVPGWTLIFKDDFDTNAAEGQFLSVYGQKWRAYPTTYRDTSKKGQYNPDIISVSNGILSMRLHTNSAGVPQVAAPEAKINGPRADINQLYGRYEVRFRADAVEGYKTAWLLWPDSEVWPRDGEIDFPEGDLTGTIGAFMHRQGATRGDDQDHFGTNARYPDWHVAILEWAPGNTRFILDGKVIGTSTSRIPNTPMRWVLQTETEITSKYPPKSAAGKVQVDYVKVWKYTPGR